MILAFIKELASHVNLLHEVVATEKDLRETLFGPQRFAEVFIGYSENEPVAYMLFCYKYSTFLGKPGIYIEDLYVKPDFRGNGIGRAYPRLYVGSSLGIEATVSARRLVQLTLALAGLRPSRTLSLRSADRKPRARRQTGPPTRGSQRRFPA